MTRRHRKLHGVWSGEGYAAINFDTFVYQKLSEMDEFNTPPDPVSGTTEQEVHIVPEGEIHELTFWVSNQNVAAVLLKFYINKNVLQGGEVDIYFESQPESADDKEFKFLVIGKSGGTPIWVSSVTANTSQIMFGYVRNFILA